MPEGLYRMHSAAVLASKEEGLGLALVNQFGKVPGLLG